MKQLPCIFTILLSFAVILSGCHKQKDITFEVPSVSISILTEKSLTIGDPIDIALTIFHEKDSTIVYPEEGESFLPFILKDFTVRKGRYKTIVIYTVTIFTTGNFKLRPLEVGIDDTILETEALNIQILSVLPKDEEEYRLKDIAPPYSPRIRPLTVAIILLAFMAASALFYFLFKFLSRKEIKKRFSEPVEIGPLFDPYQYSLSELEGIRLAYSRKEADKKQVYSKVSLVLRIFIGSLLNIHAPQMTTNELKRVIKKDRVYDIPYRRFLKILKQSDMVKFAKGDPPRVRVDEDIEESMSIVRDLQETVAQSLEKEEV